MEPFKRNSPAKRSLGQNFLADRHYIDKIINAVGPRQGETIVEIGAGRGALTESLVESGANVLAIELDQDLVPVLQRKFSTYANFRIIDQDALQVDFRDLISRDPKSKIQNPKSTRLVANLPYYISTAILQRLIEQRTVFDELILMFQREVVDRITAGVGTGERGFLTVLAEAYLHSEKLFDVPPDAFRPVPKVWSSVVCLRPKLEAEVKVTDDRLFRELVGLGFAQRRKTIQNNLKNAVNGIRNLIDKKGGPDGLLKLTGIDPKHRAEALTLENWRSLCNSLNE